MHITSSVFTNDDERGLHADGRKPRAFSLGIACNAREDNGDAHLKRQVMGREVVVTITDGRLDFGPWEQIFHGEFDGRRRKRVLVKITRE
jgi:secondary thiamine-phosphate synthase enzyme